MGTISFSRRRAIIPRRAHLETKLEMHRKNQPPSVQRGWGLLLLLGFCHVVNLCFLRSDDAEKRGRLLPLQYLHDTIGHLRSRDLSSTFSSHELLSGSVGTASLFASRQRRVKSGLICPLDSPPFFCLNNTSKYSICQYLLAILSKFFIEKSGPAQPDPVTLLKSIGADHGPCRQGWAARRHLAQQFEPPQGGDHPIPLLLIFRKDHLPV